MRSGIRQGHPGARPWVPCAVLTMLLGCGAGSEPPQRDVAPTPLDLATVGTISAVVTVEGAVPPPKELSMRATPACAAAHRGPVYDNSLLVQDGALANAVVWIKEGVGTRTFATPTEPVVIDQRRCLYDPHVAGVMVGQPVQFLNSDTEPHNVRGRPTEARAWNFMMVRQGTSQTLYMDTPEVAIPVGCDIHPWMRAYLAVFTHPYFAVTPASGTVMLEKVPPGEYVVAVWHERLGTAEQAATLEAGGTVSLRFAYQAP